MNPTKLFPLIVTSKLAETKAYYTDKAGFTLTTDMEHYFQVRFGADQGAPELCFIDRDQAPGLGPLRPFGGQGLIISIPTPSADTTHRDLERQGARILSTPADKPWGWRSFSAVDPNGVVLDFFHVLEQAAAADATG